MALEVTTREYKGKDYKNVKIEDVEYGTSVTVRLCFEKPKEFDSKFPNKDGTPKKNYGYTVEFVEPAIGEASFYAKPNLHYKLAGFKKGDLLKLTAKEVRQEFSNDDGTKRKVSYKGFDVEKVALKMSDEDFAKMVDAIKQLGGQVSEDVIRESLRLDGFTNEDDIKRVLTAAKQ